MMVGSQWRFVFIIKLLIFQTYFFKMTGSFSSLLSIWKHPLLMIASKFLSLLANYFFRTRLINGNIMHRTKSVLSNACLCLKCKGSSFSAVMAILQHPLWFLSYTTRQTYVVLVVLRVNINLLCPSGFVEFMYSRNGNCSLIPWQYNNPKGVGPYCHCSNKLSRSKSLINLVRISDLIDPLGDIHIKPGINSPWTFISETQEVPQIILGHDIVVHDM